MEKQPYEYKRECHQLMEDIWGTEKHNVSKAYMWLRQEFGKEIHFADINDVQELQTIHTRLQNKKIVQDNRRLIEVVAPAWDLWEDNEGGHTRRGRRFNKRRNRQIGEMSYKNYARKRR